MWLYCACGFRVEVAASPKCPDCGSNMRIWENGEPPQVRRLDPRDLVALMDEALYLAQRGELPSGGLPSQREVNLLLAVQTLTAECHRQQLYAARWKGWAKRVTWQLKEIPKVHLWWKGVRESARKNIEKRLGR